MSNSNLNLHTEIKQAELELKSLMLAHATIKSSIIERKKERLLAKERNLEIEERIENGEKKYENLWLQAKNRYESIPYVIKLLQSENKANELRENNKQLDNKAENISRDYNKKKQNIVTVERKRIIDLADFLINILPNGIKKIDGYTKALIRLTNEMQDLKKREQACENYFETKSPSTVQQQHKEILPLKDTSVNAIGDGWLNIYDNNEASSILIPKIHFAEIQNDFDILSAKLAEIKIKKSELLNAAPAIRTDSTDLKSEVNTKELKSGDEFSVYFKATNMNIGTDTNSNSYTKRKLINILHDVKLDHKETYEIVSKINPNNLIGVNKIGITGNKDNQREDDVEKTEDNVIEEIDMTKRPNDILNPPTQFLDLQQDNIYSAPHLQSEVIVHISTSEIPPGRISQTFTNSQGKKKKIVSFETPLSIEELTNNKSNDLAPDENEVNKSTDSQLNISQNEVNKSTDSQLNISQKSDESFNKIKDMILKKHNLDLSPQFVYAKNNMLQKNRDENTTSIFFQSKPNIDKRESQECDFSSKDTNVNTTEKNEINMENEHVLSSKKNILQKEKSVTGFLFNHGTQSIPDSLNVSISTTGYDDGDPDYAHCIDASLLLSPKADVAIEGDNQEITSQEVPNFLSGLRKTGFSLFGATSDSKPDTSSDNKENNFFNFGENKKGRGSLFSMFK
ncbi:hypothetical protein ACJJTC_004804 [Scirpophaga incertulas]